jgi:hypothetical protein
MSLEDISILAMLVYILYLHLQLKEMRWQHEKDMSYIEYHMRSMENRKQDCPEVIRERQRMREENEE